MTGDPATNAAWDNTPTRLSRTLDEVAEFLNRFMALTDAQLDAVVLWAAATHIADDFDVVAYLFINSPEKRSGKTLLMDILEHFVCRGRPTTNISPAALYRMVAAVKPTLLIDEADTIFARRGNVDPAKSDLAGLCNAGYKKGRLVYRMGGPNMKTLEAFDVFGPKALAGIGNCLPDTVADRAIPIQLARKPRDVVKDRYRIRTCEGQAKYLGEFLADVIGGEDLRDARPHLPDELNDRQQDIWEPLLAIADAARGGWPARARGAALTLHAGGEDDSLGVRLLTDIRTVFTVEKLLTKHLVSLLNDLEESPWSGWRGDKGMASRTLVNMLKPFGIHSRPIRAGDDRGRGFEREQFADAFARYLCVDTVDTVDKHANGQVKPVNVRVNDPNHGNVDGSDQRFWPDVNGVNGCQQLETNGGGE
jgi:hypothetical protein